MEETEFKHHWFKESWFGLWFYLVWKLVSRTSVELKSPCRLVTAVSHVSLQVTPDVKMMNSPAAMHAAYPSVFSATVRTTVVTGVTKLPVRTAPPSPAGRRTSACPETRSAMGDRSAETAGTSLRNFVLFLDCMGRCLAPVRLLSFSVETVSASLSPGGVTTWPTVLTAVMRKTVVSGTVSETASCVAWFFPDETTGPRFCWLRLQLKGLSVAAIIGRCWCS